MRRDHHIVVVTFDGFQSLDLTGPVEVLTAANRLGVTPLYRITTASPGDAEVTSESGITMRVDSTVAQLVDDGEEIDTLLVVGGFGTRALVEDDSALNGVRQLAARSRRITSVCTGALVLAAAGILDGRRATTHWNSCDLLSRFGDDITVEADRIWVRDGAVWTSAGVTAGIDLYLALVESDHGPRLAHDISCWLVVFTQRPGGQSQFSGHLRAGPASTRPIRQLQRWLPDNLREDLSIEALARRAGLSPRTLARRFKHETGTTPAAHVESLRVEEAKSLLQTSDLTVAAVADRVGFGSAETLHRAFQRQLGTTPATYRQHFQLTSTDS